MFALGVQSLCPWVYSHAEGFLKGPTWSTESFERLVHPESPSKHSTSKYSTGKHSTDWLVGLTRQVSKGIACTSQITRKQMRHVTSHEEICVHGIRERHLIRQRPYISNPPLTRVPSSHLKSRHHRRNTHIRRTRLSRCGCVDSREACPREHPSPRHLHRWLA